MACLVSLSFILASHSQALYYTLSTILFSLRLLYRSITAKTTGPSVDSLGTSGADSFRRFWQQALFGVRGGRTAEGGSDGQHELSMQLKCGGFETTF